MSRIDEELYVYPYENVTTIEMDNGYLVYRMGTGRNVELLHIKTFEPGKGTGRELVLDMLRFLKSEPPYCTVFGFTRTCNRTSQKFYEALGFELSEVKGVYADGTAVVFSQTYKKLLEHNNVD